jgi:hypothetical protein
MTPAVTDVRKGFIDKEKDAESGNYNLGVRQLEDDRLISIDPKWEHFRAWTPYHYSFNNPLRLKDPSGEFPVAGAIAAFVADHAVAIGISLIVTGAIVHQVTLREYTSSNQNLSTSVAGPIPQRHSPFDEGIGAAIVQSLDAVTPLGVMDALQALAETYSDAEPGEPSGETSPIPGKVGEGQSDKSTERAIKSLEEQVSKHQEKLENYLADPDAYDNKDFLKNAPNSDIRQKIIDTRAGHLRKEIKTFMDQINKLKGGQ